MSNFRLMTRIATDWARRCFGDAHVDNHKVRGIRALEEMIELNQALGVPVELARKTLETVYSRPVGDIEQEIGGVMLTLAVLCDTMDRDPEHMFEQELLRVLKKSPEHFAKRNNEKISLGLTSEPDTDLVVCEGCKKPKKPWIVFPTHVYCHDCVKRMPADNPIRPAWQGPDCKSPYCNCMPLVCMGKHALTRCGVTESNPSDM